MIHVVIVNTVKIYLESVAAMLARHDGVRVVGTAETEAEAIATVEDLEPNVVLLDMRSPDSVSMIQAIIQAAPTIKIVALAASDVESEIIAFAKIGVAGFVPRDASAQELVEAVQASVRGEFNCSPRVAGTLLRQVGLLATSRSSESTDCRLTPRETEIVELIDRGLSNKEIATDLGVEVSTVKNHVHSILHKLRVRRRGQAAARMRSGVMKTSLED